MQTSISQSAREEGISEQQIIDFLRAHPDFFIGKNDLTLKLRLSHDTSGNVASLLEHQNRLLRRPNNTLRNEYASLRASKDRHTGMTTDSQDLIKEVFLSSDIKYIHSSLKAHLAKWYSAEMFRFYFFTEPEKTRMTHKGNMYRAPRSHTLRDHFCGLLDRARPLCDCLQIEYLEFFFQKRAATVRSSVLIPLYFTEYDGLFVAASTNADIFEKGYELDMLTFVTSMLAHRVNSKVHTNTA